MFEKRLTDFRKSLEAEYTGNADPGLRTVLTILSDVKTEDDLRRQAARIKHASVDGVRDTAMVERILGFLKNSGL
ncbi:MAG TPA: hypothetical protein VEB86_07940 [Chryseosolibacter sp.]|nr:hypothetical protein [Chryseosolibacter sp.]